MLWSFAAANDPCDKVRVIGTGLRTAEINNNYTYIGELSGVNAQVSPFRRRQPIALLTEWTKQKKIKSTPVIVLSYWLLTLMLTTPRWNRTHIHSVATLHKAHAWEAASLQLRGARQVFASPDLSCTAGFDLCRWQGRFSPAQHSVGNLWRDSLSIYLRHPLPLSLYFRFLKQSRA